MTDLIIWLSAGLLVCAVAIVATFAVLARQLPPHDEDLEQLLAAMSQRKDNCT